LARDEKILNHFAMLPLQLPTWNFFLYSILGPDSPGNNKVSVLVFSLECKCYGFGSALTFFFLEPIQSSFREVGFQYGFLTDILIKLVCSKTAVFLDFSILFRIIKTDRLSFNYRSCFVHQNPHKGCVIISLIAFTVAFRCF
jgi:hypothetical protein